MQALSARHEAMQLHHVPPGRRLMQPMHLPPASGQPEPGTAGDRADVNTAGLGAKQHAGRSVWAQIEELQEALDLAHVSVTWYARTIRSLTRTLGYSIFTTLHQVLEC